MHSLTQVYTALMWLGVQLVTGVTSVVLKQVAASDAQRVEQLLGQGSCSRTTSKSYKMIYKTTKLRYNGTIFGKTSTCVQHLQHQDKHNPSSLMVQERKELRSTIQDREQ
ncbi:hypothetical protein O3P69_006168 [Scylla paramamosain]|uniref:Secreted protein n=1 Tax=Scylla paramamosain TaxID=85552 RepID=A0AAW0U6D0_SCYPA